MRIPARLSSAAASRSIAVVIAAACTTALGPTGPAAAAEAGDGSPYRAFSRHSWWNTRLPTSAPQHPDEARILSYLHADAGDGDGFLQLAGAGRSDWGQPVYWAKRGDREYNVRWSGDLRPPELDHLRIPDEMKAADTSDAALTLFDKRRGYVVAMTGAAYNRSADTWSVTGATVTYLRSNGLDALLPESDDERNIGSHRGNNGATMMARWGEVEAGKIKHVIKIACGPEASPEHAFPMVNSDGDKPSSPIKQGVRLRIRPDVRLKSMDLHREALVIAQAARRYGVYCGDSGGNTALKLENTRAEGRGQLWKVDANALAGLPFTSRYWDVLPEGYHPER